MGQGETKPADDARNRLLETARAMVLRGDNKFSIAALCEEALVERSEFRALFSGKTALMAALMREPAPQVPPAIPLPAVEPQPESQTPKAEQESSVPTPDAWLERRLRVFERALTALESRAEETARDQARVIAQLEEKVTALGSQPVERIAASHLAPAAPAQPAQAAPLQAVQAQAPSAQVTVLHPTPVPVTRVTLAPSAPAPAQAASIPVRAAHWSDAAPIAQVGTGEDTHAPAQEAPEPDVVERPEIEAQVIAPLPAPTFSKEEMADVLHSARARARAAAAMTDDEEQPTDNKWRVRWLAIGALSLIVLFLCIGFTLGNTARATQNARLAAIQGSGTSHRQLAQGALAQTIASADFGDAKAEARLALAYLRGQGVARDAGAALRWTHAAAEAGEPAAQYLMGALYQQGEVVKADPAQAFAWFATAAQKGNLKAMHNLAIAYAEGLGTNKDEAKAAQWFTKAAERGYVDSAFDLAVMYERGAGVPQDLVQALKWYGIAAHAGDQPSQARADFLRGQMNANDAKRATDAAMAFAPVPPLPSANTL